MKKIRVWDLPLRLFHWSLAVLIAIAIVTESIGGNAMEWHFRAGYAVLSLLIFRLVWGIIGPRYARFTAFFYGPSAIIDYLKGRMPHVSPGHNPLGSLSVFALLCVVLAQAVTGLFANDDIASEGPLVKFIDKALSDRITGIHADITGWLIFILVGLHILAIAYYVFVKKQNLVKPMITGDLKGVPDAIPADDSAKTRLLAVAVFAVACAIVYFIVNTKP